MKQTARHIIFTGRVQGVGFRFTVFNIANRYNLTGFVRNLPDSGVEMVAQGPDDDIAASIRDIKQSFGNYVTETKIEEIPYGTQYEDFKITF
ncbi:acylphosphatase [Planctomycetota bacterium]